MSKHEQLLPSVVPSTSIPLVRHHQYMSGSRKSTPAEGPHRLGLSYGYSEPDEHAGPRAGRTVPSYRGVVVWAMFEAAELPAALYARIRYEYSFSWSCAKSWPLFMPNPLSLNVTTPAPVEAISVNWLQPCPWHRSMRKPVSLSASSIHARSIRDGETAVAVRALGALGEPAGASSVPTAEFE